MIGWPIGAHAQFDRARLIGVLMGLAADDLEGQARLTTFEQALIHAGWVKERNARLEVRWGGASADLLRKFAAELVDLAPDVILASSSVAVAATLQATRTIPIVFNLVVDPGGGWLC